MYCAGWKVRRCRHRGPGEVRVRVITASASFTDIMVRKGIYSGVDAELPYPPGYDLVGVVDALGEGVTDLALGQRVADLTVWGAYTEYMIGPPTSWCRCPSGLPAEDAVVLMLSYLTAYQMLFRSADVKPEQVALIHGASGAVGTALAQLGRVAGLKMYGTASTAKQAYVRDLGVTPIDYKTEDFVERIMAETDGAGRRRGVRCHRRRQLQALLFGAGARRHPGHLRPVQGKPGEEDSRPGCGLAVPEDCCGR